MEELVVGEVDAAQRVQTLELVGVEHVQRVVGQTPGETRDVRSDETAVFVKTHRCVDVYNFTVFNLKSVLFKRYNIASHTEKNPKKKT